MSHYLSPGALRALRKGGTQAMMYFVRNYKEEEEQESNLEGDSVQQQTTRDPKMQQILDEYPDVFNDKLPDELPPSRDLVYEIDTGDIAPVNIQAYQLAKWASDEQTKQISDPRKLIVMGFTSFICPQAGRYLAHVH
jgi:hypothetical protein